MSPQFRHHSSHLSERYRHRITLVLMLGASLLFSGCNAGKEPVEYTEHLDLVAETRFGETQSELRELDLGTPEVRPHLAQGWSWDEKTRGGTTFVWAVGEESEVELYLSSDRKEALTLETQCSPLEFAGSPSQTLTALWNGSALETRAMSSGFTTLTFTVPATMATAGSHVLTLKPAFSREARTVLGGEDPRHLSFACDRILIHGNRQVQTRPEAKDSSLWIPTASELSFFLEADKAFQDQGRPILHWEALSLRGNARFEILWQTDQAPARILHSLDAEEATRSAALHIDLPMEPGVPARLGLRVVAPISGSETHNSTAEDGSHTSGLLLRSPNISYPASDSAEPSNADGIETVDSNTVQNEGEEEDSPSIVLWVVDTLRADRLGVYGHDRPVSPHFDRSAAQSTVFDQALAQSSWTRPTAATLLTGIGPERHGIRSATHLLDPEFDTLTERLQRAGYATAGFSGNGNVSPDTGFDQGFDHFLYTVDDVDTLTHHAGQWLDQLAEDRPFFLMIHSIEPHASFEPKEPFRSQFAAHVNDPQLGSHEHIQALGRKEASRDDDVVRQLFDLYDAEIAWNDHVFGQLVTDLEQRGLDPILVVVADHGEAFRERGVFGHGWDLHREVTHVPFWIHAPAIHGSDQEARRISWPVQQADLMPTLLDLVNLPIDEDLDGISLEPWLRGKKAPPEERILVSTMDYEGRAGAALVRGTYKLIEPLSSDFSRERLLYDLENDPLEQHNLAQDMPVLAGRLARLLKGYLAAHGGKEAQEATLDEEARKQLEALGYL